MRAARLPLLGLLLSLAGSALSAQDLAAAAAQERQRRAAVRASGASPAPTLSDQPRARPWVTFGDPGGEFTANFPAAPVASEETLQFAGRFVTRQRWTAQAGSDEYWVARADYPADVLAAPGGVELVLASLRQELRYALGEASAAVPTGVAGRVGWRLEAPERCRTAAAGRRTDCAASRWQVFITGPRVWVTAQTERSDGPVASPDEAFFESFRLTAAR